MNDDTIQSLINREENETDIEYSAFLQYAIMSEDNRTFSPDVLAHTIYRKSGLPEKDVESTRNKFAWDKRLTILDQHLYMEMITKRRKMLEKDAEDFVMESKKFTKQGMDLVPKLYNLIDDFLRTANLANKVIETGHVITKDGREVPTHTVIKMNFNVGHLKGLVETFVNLPKMLASVPNQHYNQTNNIFNIIKNVDKLSDEELDKAENDLKQKLLNASVDGAILDAEEIND
jgi:hypothetical protein